MDQSTHDMSARTTHTSKTEGRLIVGVGKKKKMLKKMVCDGKGGPGLTPSQFKNLSALGVKSATPSSTNFNIPGGTAPPAAKKFKKVSYSGVNASIKSLLKKTSVKKIASFKPYKMSKAKSLRKVAAVKKLVKKSSRSG